MGGHPESIRFAPLAPPGAASAAPAFVEELPTLIRADLLEQAMVFFDFAADKPTAGITKPGWPRLTHALLDTGVRRLRHGFWRGTLELMHSLYKMPPEAIVAYYADKTANPYLPKDDKSDAYTYVDGANRARFTVRIFASPRFRTDRFVEARTAVKGRFRGIKLELVPDRLIALSSAVTRLLANAQLTELPTFFERVTPTHDAPKTLTAHLYHHARIVAPAADGGRPTAIQDIDAAIDAIDTSLACLSSTTAAPALATFQRWDHALLLLGDAFLSRAKGMGRVYGLGWGATLASLLRAYMAELRIRIFTSAFPIDSSFTEHKKDSFLGVGLWEALVGLPWATPSFPNFMDIEVPTASQYRLKSPAFNREDDTVGYIRQAESTIGKLRSLPPAAGSSAVLAYDFVEPRADDDMRRAATTLVEVDASVRNFARQPVIRKFVEPKKGSPDLPTFVGESYESFAARARERHPVMLRGGRAGVRVDAPDRPSYYALTAIEPNPVSPLDFAASFWTQLSFFIACQLVRRISAEFGLDEFYAQQLKDVDRAEVKRLLKQMRREKGDSDDLFEKKRTEAKLGLQRLLEQPRFFLTAGSYASGGSFPPHKTHRDGRHLDISMGPNVQAWRATELAGVTTEALETLRRSAFPKSKLADLEAVPFEGPVFRIERTADDITATANVRLVDSGFVKKLIGAAVEKARKVPLEEADSPDCYSTADAITAEEEKLYGTPYWLTADDAELGHLGFVVLMLSGAEQILHAAPIAFLRCIRAIRHAFLNTSLSPQFHLDAFGVKTQAELTKHVDAMLGATRFGFLPSDHNDHWHVYFRAVRHAAMAETMSPIWALLDVDLRPFAGYLERYAKKHLANPNLGKAALEEVLTFCSNYETLRAKRLEAGPEAREATSETLTRIARPHLRNAPSATLEPCFGDEIQPVVNKATTTEMLDRSTRIKSYAVKLRKALLEDNRIPDATYKKREELAARLLQFEASVDVDDADAEGVDPDQGEDEKYDRWIYGP